MKRFTLKWGRRLFLLLLGLAAVLTIFTTVTPQGRAGFQTGLFVLQILDLGFKTAQQPIPGETGSMARLAGLAGLDQWVEVWEKTGRLAALASGLNLERKQLVLDAFLAIDNAASA